MSRPSIFHDPNIQATLGAALSKFLPPAHTPPAGSTLYPATEFLDTIAFICISSPSDPPAAVAFQIRDNAYRLVLSGGSPGAANHLAELWQDMADLSYAYRCGGGASLVMLRMAIRVYTFLRLKLVRAFQVAWEPLLTLAHAVQGIRSWQLEQYIEACTDLSRVAEMLREEQVIDWTLFCDSMYRCAAVARDWYLPEGGAEKFLDEVRHVIGARATAELDIGAKKFQRCWEKLARAGNAVWEMQAWANAKHHVEFLPLDREQRVVVLLPRDLVESTRLEVPEDGWSAVFTRAVPRAKRAEVLKALEFLEEKDKEEEEEEGYGKVHSEVIVVRWLWQNRWSRGGWPTMAYIGCSSEPCIPCRMLLRSVANIGMILVHRMCSWGLRGYLARDVEKWKADWRFPVWMDSDDESDVEEEGLILMQGTGRNIRKEVLSLGEAEPEFE